MCGMNMAELLVASHIKPWKDCNDEERIDFYNGLLLCPAHNSAFDVGYITFDDTGSIVISNLLNKQNMALLQLNENIKIPLEPNHLYYMNWHITNVFKHK
ncbi:HNH endonuclease [Bacillus cereus]|uniref:HNH endonuclease n=1 Tax=Bacillus cereus TaxID=1396 RepID=UPI0020D28311|nr:HNH endonuclease signature motif containing protein [Bacillus cereus]